MSERPDFTPLRAILHPSGDLVASWVRCFEESSLRLPGPLEPGAIAATVGPIAEALSSVVAPDRAGREPDNVRFVPGSSQLREVEKAVSFAAANLGGRGGSGFDVGALILSLRQLLCPVLRDAAAAEMSKYIDWLVVLAGDSLATGREQAAVERWHEQLDAGTPLILIAPELPAVLFVCQPDRRVVSGVFGRLLLTVVRTGAKAVIIEVQGMSGGFDAVLAGPLREFLAHPRITGRIELFACGVPRDDEGSWQELAGDCAVPIHFESHFDLCVARALERGGFRLVQKG